MTSDCSDPARRKHHHSSHSDVETDEPSKRRKHGHHQQTHHHRRRRHRHHGKKHEEIDSKLETEVKEAEVEIEGGKEVLGSGAVGVAMSSSNLGIDYDMEEGEIIEDDVPPTSAAYDLAEDIENKKFNSDMDLHEAHAEGPNFGMPTEKKVEEVDRSKNNEGLSWEGISSEKYLANGNSVSERHKHEGKCSPIEESRIQKHYCGDGNDLKDWKRSLTPDNAGKRRKTAKFASPRDRYEDDGRYGKDSKSPEQSRGLPQSQSTSEEVSVSEVFHKPDGAFNKDRKYKGDKDYERVTGLIRDYCRGSQGFLKEKERERSSSRSRYSSRDDRHRSHETVERYREGSREIDRDRTKERDRERERTREKERDRVGERNRERERVREKEIERDRAHERGRVREKEIEGGRAHERVRVREKEIESDRARERERRRDTYRDRQCDNDCQRERGSRWESDRESSRGRNRDTERDKETDGYCRANKYDLGSSYGDRDKCSASRRIKDDGTGHREKTNDPVINSSDQKLNKIETDIFKRDEDEQDYQEEISFQLAEHEEEEELDRIKEESRKRRQAILEKYKNLQLHPKTQLEDTAKEVIEHSSELEVGRNHMPQAVDGRTDGGESHSDDIVISVGKSPNQEGFSTNDQNSGAGGLGQGTPKSERSNDMFCDDIFGESPAAVHKTGKGDGLMIERSGLHDNWDDAEGYYSYRFGEVLDGRYEIIASHGKGVFSAVVRARDLKAKPGDPEEVAIKMIRNNDTMYKAGMEELVILKKLVGADPEDRRHCVRFLSSFKYRNHLCLVFESLHMNLREVLKKFGRNIGLKLTAVRTYAKQLFISLKHIKNCGVLHSDIKLDNMLVNEAKNVLKLCDFGNAMFAGKNEITPYLVSRFYRAPEIILGLPYDHPIDMWSVGCCLFELYIGKVLFPGPTNNDMLRLHMELKGPFPKKMLRKGAFTNQHFDQDLNFYATEEDPVTKKAIRKLIVNIKPRDIGAIISGSPGEDPKMLTHFKDLLDRIFVLDPDKRLTVSQALSHPFITEKISDWEKPLSWQFFRWNIFCFYCKITCQRISSRIMRQPFSALDA